MPVQCSFLFSLSRVAALHQEPLNGIMDDTFGPSSKVVKEGLASAEQPSSSGEPADYSSDGDTVASMCILEEDNWQEEEDISTVKPIIHPFSQYQPNQNPKPRWTPLEPIFQAFPCVLMVLSCYMISMQVVGMTLKSIGFTWHEFRLGVSYKFQFVNRALQWLSLLLWPPPEPLQKHKIRRKKLLLTALAIATMKADRASPEVHFGAHRRLKPVVRKATGTGGRLFSAQLSSEGASMVRDALKALPAYLFHQGDSKHLIFDSGASVIATCDKSDLNPNTVKALDTPMPMDGIGGSLQATHSGQVHYELLADDGSIAVLEAEGFYVPDLPVNLFSPQSYFEQKEKQGISNHEMYLNGQRTKLILGSQKVTFAHDPATRLPRVRCFKDAMHTAEAMAMTCVTDEYNQNLSHLQKLLLQWHWRLGHVGFQRLQWIGRQGILGIIGEKFGQSKVVPPKCAACAFGKQERNPKQGMTRKVDVDRQGILKAESLKPGEMVFSDQYQSSLPGRVFGRRGTWMTSQKYCGGTLFYDSASQYVKVVHQVSLNQHESVQSKLLFEREALQVGVNVSNYQTDNGVYTAQEFLKELVEKNQGLKHSGVGGHHHNGAAEAAIKHIHYTANTMMIHAALRWPSASDRELWPLALDHAAYLHNHTPIQSSGRSPEEIWTQTASSHTSLLHAKVWGCPVYVLDPRLQDGKKIPKWQPKSRRGQYVGASPLHASSVGVVRNLQTNNLSPQFHVVYDNFFETVHSDDKEIPAVWEHIVTHSAERNWLDAEDSSDSTIPELADEWVTPEELALRRQKRMERKRRSPAGTNQDNQQVPNVNPPQTSEQAPPSAGPSVARVEDRSQTPEASGSDALPVAEIPDDTSNDSPGLRRSGRQRFKRTKYEPGTGGMEHA